MLLTVATSIVIVPLVFGLISGLERFGVIETPIVGADRQALVTAGTGALAAMRRALTRNEVEAFRARMTKQLREIETPHRLVVVGRTVRSNYGREVNARLFGVTRHWNRKIVRFRFAYTNYPVVFVQFYFPLEPPFRLAGFRFSRDEPKDS